MTEADVSATGGRMDAWVANAEMVRADGSVLQLYDGQPVAALNTSACGGHDYGWATEMTPVSAAAGTTFYVGDHLGSAQMEFSASGTPLSMSQFMPFGVEIYPPVTANHYKFTGKERDTESGLDYFGARYYGSSMGRFMSPDPVQISKQRMLDPQQWNMYSYVRNNPLNGIDPDGKELHLIFVNSAGLSKEQFNRVTAGIAQNYRNAGVQNVTVATAGSIPFLARQDIGVDAHTVYVDCEKNHNGQVKMAAGVDGQNPSGVKADLTDGRNSVGGPGGSAAGVETTARGSQGDNGLIAVGTHETAHKYLDGVGDNQNDHTDDIMNHGTSPLNNVPFNASEAGKLRNVLNTPAEQKQYDSQHKQP